MTSTLRVVRFRYMDKPKVTPKDFVFWVGAMVSLYAGVVVHPRATVLRPQVHEAATPQSVKDEFSRSHKSAVVNNAIVLLLGLLLVLATAKGLRI